MLASMTLEQRRQLVDTSQMWEGWDAARLRQAGHRGSMAWRSVAGHDYLVRIDGPAHRRRTRSLGRQSPATERLHDDFVHARQQAHDAAHRMGARLHEMARVNRALRLARVSLAAAIVNGHLPALPFEPEHLSCFPKAAADLGAAASFFGPTPSA